MIPIKSYAEEPLISIGKKYGLPWEEGESFQFVLETNEQEGDFPLSDFVNLAEYPTEYAELESKKEIIGFDAVFEPDEFDMLPDEFFKNKLDELGININDIDEVMTFALFNKDFTELHFVGYQLQSSKFGIKSIAYKA